MRTFTFTFICSEKETGDFMDPEIIVSSSDYLGALKLAIITFENEYSDRMTVVHVVPGRLYS